MIDLNKIQEDLQKWLIEKKSSILAKIQLKQDKHMVDRDALSQKHIKEHKELDEKFMAELDKLNNDLHNADREYVKDFEEAIRKHDEKIKKVSSTKK